MGVVVRFASIICRPVSAVVQAVSVAQVGCMAVLAPVLLCTIGLIWLCAAGGCMAGQLAALPQLCNLLLLPQNTHTVHAVSCEDEVLVQSTLAAPFDKRHDGLLIATGNGRGTHHVMPQLWLGDVVVMC
jgi:hypothetical protein